ncbi:MAG: anti-sigma factor [Hyphomicrobium sp.]|nr:anti-sigma factor [Hyphomicrobium sp.]
MTEPDDIDGLAAEYVLGTLDAGERAAVAARRQREVALDAAIVSWESRLAALSDVVPPIAPPSGLFSKIEARLHAVSSVGISHAAAVVALTRRLNSWRVAAITASSIAAALLVAFGATQFAPKPKGKNLVAVLQKDAQSPAFLVSVNVDDRVMTVRPVSAKHEAGKSYELWIIHESLGKPKSLGVVDDAAPTRAPTLAAYKPDVLEASTYAVTLEPEGGSPSGDPTGPIVFSGKMIEATGY